MVRADSCFKKFGGGGGGGGGGMKLNQPGRQKPEKS